MNKANKSVKTANKVASAKPASKPALAKPAPLKAVAPAADDAPIIALNLPMAKLTPAMAAYFKKCQEKLGFIPNVLPPTPSTW